VGVGVVAVGQRVGGQSGGEQRGEARVSGTEASRAIEPTSVATMGSATSWTLSASAVATFVLERMRISGRDAPT
jgi:hypothetical protein